ncbi:MAG TPA: phosphatase domain-containing protein [Myxococcaceae bacterium]|nr:phosphatase domain-containing protein [Myxococcaceae bacterium]
MSLPDRIDPPPPKRIYRWDLDKTYLKTDFDTLRQLVRTALQSADQKVTVPGAAALIRELRERGDSRLCIVSGSPKQMRSVLEEKLKLDGVEWDELILKDNVRNVLRGRFRALRGQVGYKLPAILESRATAPAEAEEILFGDDAEADAFIYSLYADLLAGRVEESVLLKVLEHARVYEDDRERVLGAWKKTERADPVRRIFIHLDRLTPPARFSAYGPRVIPVFNYFQAALVLMADGVLSAPQVVRVAVEMVQSAGYNLLTLANSFQDMIRRGHPLQELANPLVEALQTPNPILNAMRPVPDIVAAFTKRLAVLGAPPPPPKPVKINYLELLDDARPRNEKEREDEDDDEDGEDEDE